MRSATINIIGSSISSVAAPKIKAMSIGGDNWFKIKPIPAESRFAAIEITKPQRERE